jgi:hypothetical protein
MTDNHQDEERGAVLAVSPLTGHVYAVDEYEDGGDGGKIVAEQKRTLERDEYPVDVVHELARRALER